VYFIGGEAEWRLFGRPRCERLNNIKKNLDKVICGGMEWIALVQDMYQWRAPANATINLLV
jgi:hypothetical protein